VKPFDVKEIISSGAPVVLFGAGRYGKVAHFAITRHGIKPTHFCDSDTRKQGTTFCGLEVISPETLRALGDRCHIFISCAYVIPVVTAVQALNLPNLHDCVSIFDATDFTGANIGMSGSEIGVMVERYKAACLATKAAEDPRLIIRGMDIMATEACSMKCKDCSNLMQYYTAPKNGDPALVMRAFDKMALCVDTFLEVRVLGGEPFLNKRVHEIVNTLTAHANVEKVAVFTNATIVPKGENLECLKHPKVYLDITHYGALSRNHDRLIDTLDAAGIAYTTHKPHTWTDSGKIVYRERTEDELTRMFSRCCVNDVLTLQQGMLYRCPFSANAMTLRAVPRVPRDFIDLEEDGLDRDSLRERIKHFYTARTYISSCSWCNGRDFTVPVVEAGIQTPTVLTVEQIFPA
jgi:organic radical activating enzyme